MHVFVKIIKMLAIGVGVSLLVAALIVVYAFKIEPYLLKTETLTLQADFSEPLTIVQISDVQISASFTTDQFEKVVNAVNHEKPDVVLFTGDLYESYAEYQDDDALIAALSNIHAAYGKYAIWGNRDYGGGAVRVYETIMEAGGFQVLCNDSASIVTSYDERLLLSGMDDALLGNPDKAVIEEHARSDGLQNATFSLLMMHEPDLADEYADLGYDLILAGHSHGGQVRIPFLPRMTTAMAEKYIDGWYSLKGDTCLYVHSGIGTSRYPMRFGVPPKITVLTLAQGE